MALLKDKTIKSIIGLLIASNIILGAGLIINNKKLKDLQQTNIENIDSSKNTISNLNSDINKLQEELSIKLNSESDIRLIRGDLIFKINEVIQSKNKEIAETDILRAFNSTENRLMEEYIRVLSLILATMETETNFKYITCNNTNGTKDHGIMQVNDAIIPDIKEVLGDNIDPINNKDHNVEAGSWEIYECYLKAKNKHPEDVIWWTYAYYNRGLYFENTDSWKNPNNSNYKKVHNQANVRSNKFKECYNAYYEELIKLI